MPTYRRILIGLVCVALVIGAAACRSTATSGLGASSDSQILVAASPTPTHLPSGEVVWGRVPECSCFLDSATDSVADALKKANLTVNLQELSPRDGWLYFAVTFDPASATLEQVRLSMTAGGAEVLDGLP